MASESVQPVWVSTVVLFPTLSSLLSKVVCVSLPTLPGRLSCLHAVIETKLRLDRKQNLCFCMPNRKW